MNENEFLKPEDRCGFHVSEKRKKIWAVLLSLIEEFTAQCEKQDLRWFASNGTLLGAVRHKGFVPWDDDVDIVMPRSDYDRLVSIAPKVFLPPFFFHTSEPDGTYFKDYARLRRDDTTALTKRDWGHGECRGIFIDIFPLDRRPDSDRKWKWHRRKINFLRTMLNMYAYGDQYKPSGYRRAAAFLGKTWIAFRGWESLCRKFETERKRFEDLPTKKLFQYVHGSKLMEYPKEWFERWEEAAFENLSLRIPGDSDAFLKLHYGDYMQLPPPEKRGLHHSIFFDPDKPWREYEGKISLAEAQEKMNDY